MVSKIWSVKEREVGPGRVGPGRAGPGRFTLEIDYIHKNKTFFIYSLFSKKSILKKLRIDSVSSICVSEWALSRSEAAFGGSASLRSQ